MHPETFLAHAGAEIDPTTRSVVSPIHLSTTYERAVDGSYPGGYVYARSENPTRRQFEQMLATLEGGAECAAFASGQAATLALLHMLPAGSHIIIPEDAYFGIGALLGQTLAPYGFRYSRVDQTNLDAVRAEIRPETRMIWAESPSNPRCLVSDLATLAELAHAHEAQLVVDNTWATALLQRPLELGADWVMHSVTKYLAGHSDVLAGAVVARTSDENWARLRQNQVFGGGVMDPFSAFLTMRGMRSLAARMRVHQENARIVATFLQHHPAIEAVHYPGLPDHPQHEIAKRQMKGFGGMLSVQINGGAAEARRGAASVRVFARATSLGGTESLIEHRASVENPPGQSPANLLRCSIGLEHPDDLVADLDQALATLHF